MRGLDRKDARTCWNLQNFSRVDKMAVENLFQTVSHEGTECFKYVSAQDSVVITHATTVFLAD
jgi:hypothetical protein